MPNKENAHLTVRHYNSLMDTMNNSVVLCEPAGIRLVGNGWQSLYYLQMLVEVLAVPDRSVGIDEKTILPE